MHRFFPKGRQGQLTLLYHRQSGKRYPEHSIYGLQLWFPIYNQPGGNNDTALYAHVLYVASGSPAAAIRLERGDWIMEMNGEPITSKNYENYTEAAPWNLR